MSLDRPLLSCTQTQTFILCARHLFVAVGKGMEDGSLSLGVKIMNQSITFSLLKVNTALGNLPETAKAPKSAKKS